MKPRCIAAATLLLALRPAGAAGQTKPIAAPGSHVPQTAIAFGATGGAATPVTPANPLPTGGVRESFQLVAANTASGNVTLYGGDYVLAQTCSAYGTLTLQVRGPDAATWLPLVAKTASDTGGGTGVALGSYAVVRVSLSGTTGCNAILSRVPS